MSRICNIRRADGITVIGGAVKGRNIFFGQYPSGQYPAVSLIDLHLFLPHSLCMGEKQVYAFLYFNSLWIVLCHICCLRYTCYDSAS